MIKTLVVITLILLITLLIILKSNIEKFTNIPIDRNTVSNILKNRSIKYWFSYKNNRRIKEGNNKLEVKPIKLPAINNDYPFS